MHHWSLGGGCQYNAEVALVHTRCLLGKGNAISRPAHSSFDSFSISLWSNRENYYVTEWIHQWQNETNVGFCPQTELWKPKNQPLVKSMWSTKRESLRGTWTFRRETEGKQWKRKGRPNALYSQSQVALLRWPARTSIVRTHAPNCTDCSQTCSEESLLHAELHTSATCTHQCSSPLMKMSES